MTTASVLGEPRSEIRGGLSERFTASRQLTEELAAPLSPEDQCIQSMPDVSPTKWHRAHVTWFFETFVLPEQPHGFPNTDPLMGYLFNSYYESVGDRHPRAARGMLSRPSAEEVGDYRARVDSSMLNLLAGELSPKAAALTELGIQHEQQHQELLLMDIKHVLSQNPAFPAYLPAPTAAQRPPASEANSVEGGVSRWVSFPGGRVEVGADGGSFAFDNETPLHEVLLQPYELGDRLVTCGEWSEFMADGGYQNPLLWLSDGWSVVQDSNWRAPLYWMGEKDGWEVFTLFGLKEVDPAEPVCHVSYYEADAFARWAGARLPTEFEWSAAACPSALDAANLLDLSVLQPRPLSVLAVSDRSSLRLRQVIGDVWEWTSSAYAAYPGFEPASGAVGEYNGKFMVNQMVLKGGCCVTPADHIRISYRNFFPPSARWAFSGLRLARNL